jgi:tetratricopeptide (TPR) repeat protein
MSDQSAASRLAREAFAHWEGGRLEDAAVLYREALSLASPGHYALGDYHGEFACVLNDLGKHDEAQKHFELAATVQRQIDGEESAIGVSIARYFLANHLVQHGDAARALEVIAPSLVSGTKTEWLLHVIEAEALATLNRLPEARQAAGRALDLAPSQAKRVELRDRFVGLGVSDAG